MRPLNFGSASRREPRDALPKREEPCPHRAHDKRVSGDIAEHDSRKLAGGRARAQVCRSRHPVCPTRSVLSKPDRTGSDIIAAVVTPQSGVSPRCGIRGEFLV
jgi:hypothetical protein